MPGETNYGSPLAHANCGYYPPLAFELCRPTAIYSTFLPLADLPRLVGGRLMWWSGIQLSS